jgi:hypothetical protein
MFRSKRNCQKTDKTKSKPVKKFPQALIFLLLWFLQLKNSEQKTILSKYFLGGNRLVGAGDSLMLL